MHRYLITYIDTDTQETKAFLDNYFDSENHFNADVSMCVYDLNKAVFTTDGKTWNEITENHL